MFQSADKKSLLNKLAVILCCFFGISLLVFFLLPKEIKAQQSQTSVPKQEFYKAKVIRIIKEGEKSIGGYKNLYQNLEVELLDGNEKSKKVTIENGGEMSISPEQKVVQGDTVIILKESGFKIGQSRYTVYEKYRINTIIFISILFFLLTIIIAGWKGFGSFAGLLVSLAIILLYIIPQILNGADPIMVSIYGSLIILLITTYLAHGVSKQTTVALFSTFIALLLTSWFSTLLVDITNLTGINEETSLLQFSANHVINLKGLLLAGIIIGTLGALNDITTTQTAAIFEFAKIDKKLSIENLFKKGFLVGKEHIASLINTIVLAYAGSSLIIFIFLSLNPSRIPYWVIINNELISGEIVRTIAGSMGLMLVVPIVTIFAAFVASKISK